MLVGVSVKVEFGVTSHYDWAKFGNAETGLLPDLTHSCFLDRLALIDPATHGEPNWRLIWLDRVCAAEEQHSTDRIDQQNFCRSSPLRPHQRNATRMAIGRLSPAGIGRHVCGGDNGTALGMVSHAYGGHLGTDEVNVGRTMHATVAIEGE